MIGIARPLRSFYLAGGIAGRTIWYSIVVSLVAGIVVSSAGSGGAVPANDTLFGHFNQKKS